MAHELLQEFRRRQEQEKIFFDGSLNAKNEKHSSEYSKVNVCLNYTL